jgi:hypothetical protein
MRESSPSPAISGECLTNRSNAVEKHIATTPANIPTRPARCQKKYNVSRRRRACVAAGTRVCSSYLHLIPLYGPGHAARTPVHSCLPRCVVGCWPDAVWGGCIICKLQGFFHCRIAAYSCSSTKSRCSNTDSMKCKSHSCVTYGHTKVNRRIARIDPSRGIICPDHQTALQQFFPQVGFATWAGQAQPHFMVLVAFGECFAGRSKRLYRRRTWRLVSDEKFGTPAQRATHCRVTRKQHLLRYETRAFVCKSWVSSQFTIRLTSNGMGTLFFLLEVQ